MEEQVDHVAGHVVQLCGEVVLRLIGYVAQVLPPSIGRFTMLRIDIL